MADGLVTFLLTEAPGSVAAWESDGARMQATVARLDSTVAGCVRGTKGRQVKPRGEGDSHFLVFDDPSAAVACALHLGRSPVARELGLRMAIHVGRAQERDGDFYGQTVNRVARIRSSAAPGQILVSATAREAIKVLPERSELEDLGRHRLKDLDEPTRVFQLVHPDLPSSFPPLASLPIHHGLSLPLTKLVGRAAATTLETLAARLADRPGIVRVGGPPGVGKSRVAMEAATHWFAEDRGDVSLVRLSCGDDPAGLPSIGGDRLVILDDADHHPDLPEQIASLSPGWTVLVTTRGPADVDVPPLDESESIALLVDRGVDRGTAAELVTALASSGIEGRPLALELTAFRLASVPAAVLIDRLSDPARVLAGPERAEPPHHRSWRDALSWAELPS